MATIAATAKLLGTKLKKEEICTLAYEVEKLVHKHPSGVDNYISTYGGITIFRRNEKLVPLKINKNLILVIGNTGISRSTGKLVGHVRKMKEAHPTVITPILNAIGQLSVSTAQALQEGNLRKVGELMNVNHGLLSALGVSNEALNHLVYAAREAGALGAKLTGGGGGGCIIALATPDKIKRVAEAIKTAGGTAMVAKKIDRGVEVWKGQ